MTKLFDTKNADSPTPHLLSAEEATKTILAALRSPNPFVVIRSTPGVGKSLAVYQRTSEAPNERVALFVPTHKLGAQTVLGLKSLNVIASRPLGIARRPLPGQLDRLACLYPQTARLMVATGTNPRTALCNQCPHQQNHPITKNKCPTYGDESPTRVVVLMHQLLAETLVKSAKNIAQNNSEELSFNTIIIDELPSLTEQMSWKSIDYINRHKEFLTQRTAKALGPLVEAIGRVIKSTKNPTKEESLRDILNKDGCTDIDKIIDAARAASSKKFWKSHYLKSVGGTSMSEESKDPNLTQLTNVANATTMLKMLIEAAHQPDRPLLWHDEPGSDLGSVENATHSNSPSTTSARKSRPHQSDYPRLATLAPWVRQVQPFIDAGGTIRILDATTPVDALCNIWHHLNNNRNDSKNLEPRLADTERPGPPRAGAPTLSERGPEPEPVESTAQGCPPSASPSASTAVVECRGESQNLYIIDVKDAPNVRRRYLSWSRGARGSYTAKDKTLKPRELRGPLSRLSTVCKDENAKIVGIITHQVLADALRDLIEKIKKSFQTPHLVKDETGSTTGVLPGDPGSEIVYKSSPQEKVKVYCPSEDEKTIKQNNDKLSWHPAELDELIATGVEIRVGHYNAHRGLNLWEDVDVLATVGDPWPNIGEARIEATVLGADPKTWATQKAQAELVQAWGRARHVHRKTSCLVVHLGGLHPLECSLQWDGVEEEKPNLGRPQKPIPFDTSICQAQKQMSNVKHAHTLGISVRTFYRRKRKNG